MARPADLLHHRTEGPADAPLLVLGPSLGTSTAVWEPHVARLAGQYRVLRFDLPGHGGSSAAPLPDPRPGGTSMADLARLVLDLADHHGHHAFHYAGISLGGAIGAHLAVHHPDRISSLCLISSSARFGDPAHWRDRAAEVRRRGTAPLLKAAAQRWFADPATAATARGAALLRDLAGVDPAGYAACCDAIAGHDLRADLPRVTAPALVVAGARDVATPPSQAEELARGMGHAALVTVDSGHLAAPGETAAVTDALLAHLAAVAGQGARRP
ncbi:alpha/beta fold hydrolase [Streptomyces sp. NPDC050856]|uniref:alpha/beta fold hydrolase n=1 Tax=Streptomyces sp. NPDC050856 TaxID=3154939 RepID=UPI0033F1B00D